jgi:ankyrin repeat protein
MDLTVNAVRRAPISTVRLFLDRSNLTNRVHECLLCYAVIRAKDRLEAIELLLNLGCLIDSFWSEGFRFLTSRNRPTLTGTALLHAVTLEHEEEVTYLLSKGADATIKSSDGRTVLEVAEAHGNIKVVRLIQSSLRSQ